VVFHYPRDPQKSYIKRVIAVPGDELRIDDGRTYINGRLLPEPYVPRKFHDSRSQDAMVIPPVSISSWAIIARFPATAATSDRCLGI
jgi:signal peptidase I